MKRVGFVINSRFPGGEFREGHATSSSSDRMGRLRVSNEFHEILLDRPGGK